MPKAIRIKSNGEQKEWKRNKYMYDVCIMYIAHVKKQSNSQEFYCCNAATINDAPHDREHRPFDYWHIHLIRLTYSNKKKKMKKKYTQINWPCSIINLYCVIFNDIIIINIQKDKVEANKKTKNYYLLQRING